MGARKSPRKNTLLFLYVSSPHTDFKAAILVGKCIDQFLEYLGFAVIDECWVPSDYDSSKESSTRVRMGDISEKLNKEDKGRYSKTKRRMKEGDTKYGKVKRRDREQSL